MLRGKRQIIVGVDIGNSKVTTLVGEKEEEKINFIGFGKVPLSGLRKGTIVDIDETITALSLSLEEAERMIGFPIDRAYLSVSGSNVYSLNSKGVIAISRSGAEITKEDINRVLEAAKAVSIPPNKEIIHVLPKIFIIDGQEELKDPIGAKGVRLEVEAHLITVSSPVIKTLLKCAYQAGLDVQELVFSPLAASSVLLSKKQKEIGVLLCDIGAGTTDIAVYEEGSLIHSAVIPLGGIHLTSDIAIGLKISLELAEKIKLTWGVATPHMVSERVQLDLSELDPSQNIKVPKKYVAEIIEARIQEIFSLVRQELRKIGRDGLLPAGVVLTGGTSKLPQIEEVAKDSLKLPAQLGKVIPVGGVVDKEKLEDPSNAVALGLVFWGKEKLEKESLPLSFLENFSQVFSKIKGLFRKS